MRSSSPNARGRLAHRLAEQLGIALQAYFAGERVVHAVAGEVDQRPAAAIAFAI